MDLIFQVEHWILGHIKIELSSILYDLVNQYKTFYRKLKSRLTVELLNTVEVFNFAKVRKRV